MRRPYTGKTEPFMDGLCKRSDCPDCPFKTCRFPGRRARRMGKTQLQPTEQLFAAYRPKKSWHKFNMRAIGRILFDHR